MCLMHRHHGDPRVGGGRAGGKQVAGYKYMEVVASAMAVVQGRSRRWKLGDRETKPVRILCLAFAESGQ